MHTMATRWVLFDADGVLIHAEQFSNQYQKAYHVSVEDMLPFFDGEFMECIIGKADLLELLPRWLPKRRWPGTAEEFLQYRFSAENRVDERMIQVIERLKQNWIPCFLATNQEKYRMKYMMHEMGFGSLFDHCFASCDLGNKKPQPAFYQAVLGTVYETYGFAPQEIMFFDDKKENIDTARALGIDAYLYDTFEDFTKIVSPLLGR